MKVQIAEDYGIVGDALDGVIRPGLSLCCTSGVSKKDYDAALYGLKEIIAETRKNLKIISFGSKAYGVGAYSSPDWYQNQCLTCVDNGFGPQVGAYALNELLLYEPFQKENPHFDFFIIDKDLRTYENDHGNRFVFGLGSYPVNIISTKRLNNWIPNDADRFKAIAVLSAHEFVHLLGLVHRDVNRGDSGYKRGHCNGEKGACLMEQVNVSGCRPIDDQAKLVFPKANWLCPDCTNENNARRVCFKENRIFY